MKATLPALTLAAILISPASQAFFGQGNTTTDVMTQMATQFADDQASESPLVQAITEQVDVSPTQAAGGASALLAMAANQLTGNQQQELASLRPDLSSLSSLLGDSGIGDNIGSLESLYNVADTLGIDAATLQQFVPIVLDYLGQQGASEGLLSALTGLWP
ncbi:DUF2780 domain-containing protein [Salinivibrio proteolyticus]|uniref:DUF2780 domain-containing protein n=1 Tax=Salinivibrio proteolyticus TaxID=334715 RepID=UPI000989593F|nr:DUF2780 domain-containing protein [Salinivibrio proteolyticus]OOF32038.1 hypothetical protein BZJ20_02540 [Salinivibrio proteolyticus]